MTQQSTLSFADKLIGFHDEVRLEDFATRHVQPELLADVLKELQRKEPNLIEMMNAGTSFEGRPIYLLHVGTGKTGVLLWSQMHGDESTATMAIADILNCVVMKKHDRQMQQIMGSLTLHFVPMLNPDGAARCRRRTAQGIDMNRDAAALVTPEARLLKKLQEKPRPAFGFNLHDQELSTVGLSKELSAFGVLAPAFDEKKSDNEVRTRAKHLASTFVGAISRFVDGKIARYDDTYEPRAFGDNMQRWGTSTLLVESGHARDDPQKDFIRKLNFVGILSTLYAVAAGEVLQSDIAAYESLPFNSKKAYDIIIRNIMIDHGRNVYTNADLGISYQVETHSGSTPQLVDLGDLSTYVALKELDGGRKLIPASSLVIGEECEWEELSSMK